MVDEITISLTNLNWYVCVCVCVCVFLCMRSCKFDPNYQLSPRTLYVALQLNADVQNAHEFAFVKLVGQFLIQCRQLVLNVRGIGF